MMSVRILASTTERILRQLLHDRRTIALMLVVVLIALFIVFLQMFVRGAELAVYVIGAPLVALGLHRALYTDLVFVACRED